MSAVSRNRRATYDYAIERRLEAGLVLTGEEIKALRLGRSQVAGAFIKLTRGVPHVYNMIVNGTSTHDRKRALLLSAREIEELSRDVEGGKQIVPLRIYVKRRWAKLEIGVGKRMKKYDKRHVIREKDRKREESA